jgi:8-oxo-dGTP pyrophosphatase MutT (NUDIX family)
VFVHRDVALTVTGVQVPAGTVRPGEDPVDAVLRETREETGDALGTGEYLVGDETHVRHFFALAPTGPLPETWESAEEHDGLREPTPLTFSWIPVEEGHVLAAGLGTRLSDL